MEGGEGPSEVGPPLKGGVAALHPGSDLSRAAALTWMSALINCPSSSTGKDQRGTMQPTFARDGAGRGLDCGSPVALGMKARGHADLGCMYAR